MQTRAYLVVEIVSDAGDVVFTMPRHPLSEEQLTAIGAGPPRLGTPATALPLSRDTVLPPAPLPGSHPAPLPADSSLPIVEDYRYKEEEAAAMREMGIAASQGTPESWSPEPRPLLEQGIRPGGNPRQRLSSGGDAMPAARGLADGLGNTITAQAAAGPSAAPAPGTTPLLAGEQGNSAEMA